MGTWLFNEFKHPGVNFDDPRQVETYDSRQRTDLECERSLVRQLGIRPGQSVLEYGCGTGAFAIAAAEAGALVVAVDISQSMLAYAKHMAEAAGLITINWMRGGFLTSVDAGRSFDFVITKFALHHLPDFWKVAALRRIFHALHPGGVLYLQDVVFSFEPDRQTAEIERWISSAAASGSFSRADFEAHIRDEFSTYGVAMEAMLNLAGLRIAKADYYSKVQASYLCIKP